MTTSSSFEMTLRGEQGILFRRGVDALEIPLLVRELLPIRAEEAFAVSVRRTVRDGSRLRVRLGSEVIAEFASGSSGGETGLEPWLRDEFGESRVAVER